MPIATTKLHPLFSAEIGGVDTGQPIDDATFAQIRAALDEFGAGVREQTLDDDKQIAFSRRFGPLEIAGKANPAPAPISRGSPTSTSPPARSFRRKTAAWSTRRAIPLASRQLVQAGAVAVFVVVGAHRSTRGRQHRIRRYARRL